jgi:hypothetical protein
MRTLTGGNSPGDGALSGSVAAEAIGGEAVTIVSRNANATAARRCVSAHPTFEEAVYASIAAILS